MPEALDNAGSADAVAALTQDEARQQHPDVLSFIESGTLPPALTVRTGEQVPPAPAAGGILVPGLPPPYGVYTPNPTNNWGMPVDGNDDPTEFDGRVERSPATGNTTPPAASSDRGRGAKARDRLRCPCDSSSEAVDGLHEALIPGHGSP